MKRITALLVVLVTGLLLAPSAQAAAADSKRVKQSREAVVSYWTKERMRNAKPVERKRDPFGKPAGSGAKKPSAGAATEVPAPYTGFPTSTNGKVFFTDHGVNYVCSGTAIKPSANTSAAKGSVVWTAGHCVNEGPGQYYTNWAFVPAYRDNVGPYGEWAARTLHTTTAWQERGDFSYDIGAAVVWPSGTTSLTDRIGGGRELAFNYDPRGQRYNSFGYPAASPFNGQRLWKCDSSLYMSDSSTSPQTMGIQCNMTGGSSGGGWVAPNDGKVYSVNSYGYSSLRNVMFGPYQDGVAKGLFDTAEKAR